MCKALRTRRRAAAAALLVIAMLAGCSSQPGQAGEAAPGPREAALGAGHHGAHATVSAPPSVKDDKGWSALSNGQLHAIEARSGAAPATPEVRASLSRQLALAAGVVRKYPTAAAAEAAGYRRAGGFRPGMGVHYVGGLVNSSGTIGTEEIQRPSGLIYGGMGKAARIVGLMYISRANGGGPIEGFAGNEDVWHRHTGLCIKRLPGGVSDVFGADGSVSRERCESLGAEYRTFPNSMVHVWAVPGRPNPIGVFAGLHPGITCPDGSYHIDDRDPLNACSSRAQ